jgi:hypothetical protein
MREQPKQESEIVSQAYYSEEVKVVEENQDWAKIETLADHYQGWVKKAALYQRNDAYLNADSTVAKVSRCAAHLYSVQDTVYGPLLTLPFDSKLEVLEPKEVSDSRWIKVGLVDGREGFIQRGDVMLATGTITPELLYIFCAQFYGLPYTWGGRSSFGYDCSGFVQMMYRQMGISLPRDSKDQARWEGFVEVSFDSLKAGDLIFFGPSEDKIRHVGMFLGETLFIHATFAENLPFIRISNLNDPNWNGSTKYRTARRLKSSS